MTYIVTHNDKLSYVYTLVDPRDKQPFYVGKTYSPDVRITAHISDGRKCRVIGAKTKASIIKEILHDGYEPIMRIIEITTERYVYEREFTWWQGFVERGYKICNTVNYGRGYNSESANLPDPEPLSEVEAPPTPPALTGKYTIDEINSASLDQKLEMLIFKEDRRKLVDFLMLIAKDEIDWERLMPHARAYIEAGV